MLKLNSQIDKKDIINKAKFFFVKAYYIIQKNKEEEEEKKEMNTYNL
jgi:hypothetical protein